MQHRHVGLTGGIGSGKSTVATLLATQGATIIDSDQIAREVTGPSGAAVADIRATFGDDFIDTDGALDRAKMRALAFQDPGARLRLEHIVHPLVSSIGAQRAKAAEQANCPLVVFDIPLLAESERWPRKLDAVIVVDCPPDIQMARVIARSGLTADTVRSIIASQASPSVRRRCADIVIYNGGHTSLEDLEHAVKETALRFGL